MVERYIGIDIGTYNIKIADIKRNKNAFEIGSHAILKTPRFLIENGRISDANELISLIKSEISKRKIKSKKAIIILNDSLVITRDMEIPAAKPKEIEYMVKLDASEYLPNDVSEYTIRYKILLPANKNPKNKNHILMNTIKTDLALDFYNVFKKVGLKVVSFDTTVNCMIKYFKWLVYAGDNASYLNERTVCMLDLGANNVKLVIFQLGNLASQYVLNHSSQKIDLMIANLLSVEREEAEECKIKYGLQCLYEASDDVLASTVGSVINMQIDIMLGDVYKHIQNHNSKEGSRQVDEIWLMGGMSKMKGLNKYISDSFAISSAVVETNGVAKFSIEELMGDNEIENMSDQFPFYTNIIGASWKGE